MPHEVFVGIAQDVVAFGAVFGEVESLVFKNSDQLGQSLDHLIAAAKLVGIVEVRHVGELVGVRQWGDDLFIDLVADVRLALEGHHVFEARTLWNSDRRVGHIGIFIADVFDEQQHQHVIFILRSVHTAAQFVTGLPKGRVKFRFFDGHGGRNPIYSSLIVLVKWLDQFITFYR